MGGIDDDGTDGGEGDDGDGTGGGGGGDSDETDGEGKVMATEKTVEVEATDTG